MSDDTHSKHGPDCHCNDPDFTHSQGWMTIAAGAIVQDAMRAHLAEKDDKAKLLRESLLRFTGEVQERGEDLSLATANLMILIGLMVIAQTPEAAWGDGEGITQAVMIDTATGMVLDEPDYEANTPELLGGLTASRIVAALVEEDVERAYSYIAALPDGRAAAITLFLLCDMAGRVTLEHFEQAGLLTEEALARLNELRREDEASHVEPDVRRSPSTGREFVRLPDTDISDEDMAEYRATSRGPAVYAMAILGPQEDNHPVAAKAHAEMVESAVYEGFLCDHLHFTEITLMEMPAHARQYAAREVRRREKMLGETSKLLLIWRHTRECHGADVMTEEAAD